MKAQITGLLLLFFLGLGSAHSQVLIGPTAGANFSWCSFGDKDLKSVYNVNPVWGYHAGAQLSFRVRKRFFLHTSLIYSTKGQVLKEEEKNLELKASYRYIEMPIVYTVNFKGTYGKKDFKYFFGVGPNVSYWLGGKGSIENQDTHEFNEHGTVIDYKIKFHKDPYEAEYDELVVQQPNRIQLGLNFTAGLVFEPARDREMFLTLRYELGHSYLSGESYGAFGATFFQQPMQVRNQGLRISISYLIDMKVEQRKKGKSTIKKKMS